MASLPEVGVKAVVAAKSAFDAAMRSVNKVIEESGKKAEQAAKRTAILEKAFDTITKAAIKAQNAINGASNRIASGIHMMASKVIGAIGSVTKILTIGFAAGIGLVIAAVGSLVAALGGLATRGANLRGIVESFNQTAATAQQSSTRLLQAMQEASAGTIADIELMRQANLALAGSQGEVAKTIGEALPQLLEIARVQARATGQEVNYLFESLIIGIKRSSPLLIDNTGLVLNVGAANERYAESIGKTVEQLSAQEQQIALIQAVLEAGERQIALLGDVHETAAEKIARAGATITNIFDTLSINIQPAFEAVLDIINGVLTGIGNLVRHGAVYIRAIAELIKNALQPIIGQINGFAESLNSPAAARSFFTGAANTFGSYLKAVVDIGTQIINAVADIAQAIADFLIGQSPPPKGPLAKIDSGGRNVMLAWLEGMTGVSLEPVKRVAAQVNRALGDIGKLNLVQVEKRLAQLDRALQPFADRLAIVKANFEAISAPAEAALRAIERQMDAAVGALMRGEEGSAETVRALDAQREMIERALDAQQRLVDQAQIQLALAQAQQSRERVLLGIQKERLEAVKKTAEAVRETGEERSKGAAGAGKAPTEPKGSGGGEAPALTDTGGLGGVPAGTPLEGTGFDFKPSEIKQAQADLQGAFAEGFGTAGQDFEAARSRLQQGADRIGKGLSALPEKIRGALEGAVDEIRHNIEKALIFIADHVTYFFNVTVPKWESAIEIAFRQHISNPIALKLQEAGAHFDPTVFGSFAYTLATLPTRIDTWLKGVHATITREAARLENSIRVGLVNPVATTINDGLRPIFDQNTVGSVAYFFGTLPARIGLWLANLEASINENLIDPVVRPILEAVSYQLDPANTDGLVGFFVALPGRVIEQLASWGQTIYDNLVQPVLDKVGEIKAGLDNFFAGSGEGTLSGILDAGVAFFAALPERIGAALASIGDKLYTTFVVPIIEALNTTLESFEAFLNSLVPGIIQLAESLQPLADLAGQGGGLAAAVADLRQNGIQLGRIRVDNPFVNSGGSFGGVPGAATGGVFTGGMLRVHRGEEIIASAAQRLTVFPANVVRALDAISSAIPGAAPLMAGGMVNNASYSYDQSRHYGNTTIYGGVQNDAQVMQRLALLRAMER